MLRWRHLLISPKNDDKTLFLLVFHCPSQICVLWKTSDMQNSCKFPIRLYFSGQQELNMHTFFFLHHSELFISPRRFALCSITANPSQILIPLIYYSHTISGFKVGNYHNLIKTVVSLFSCIIAVQWGQYGRTGRLLDAT